MKSIFTDDVSKELPLPEYPRPQLHRDGWQNLNGMYNYKISGKHNSFPSEFDGKILVPFAIESMLSGVQKPFNPSDRLWYNKNFTLDRELKGKDIILNFGAVDWQCKVFINRQLAGTHTGGYCSFSFNITDLLIDGENELDVCVYDPTESGWQQRGKQDNHPHGFWYTSTSGIWQTVWLEAVEKCYVKKINLLPDIDNDFLKIKTVLSDDEAEVSLKATVYDNGKSIIEKAITKDDEIKLKGYELWSPENPKLYDIKIEVTVDGKITDTVNSYFGMRKFNIAKDEKGIMRLFLNNQPYFQRGLLDQGYFCDGGLTPPTDEAMIFDITEMKRLGFNMLRKHIKVEPMRWYYHCDRLGMIVWQDMVSGGEYIGDFYAGVLPNLGIKVKDDKYDIFSRSEKKWRDNYYDELTDVINQLYSVVSIYCWVPFNEAWGQFDALKVCQYVRSLDSSRVIDHASGWYDQGGGDINSMHKYILPIKLRKPEDNRAFVITEFGGYSRIVSDHSWNEKKAFGYLMYKTKEDLTKAYKKLIEKQIIPIIDKGLSGTIYTQVTDVENEVNGIYTYDRTHLKIEEDVLIDLNKQLKY